MKENRIFKLCIVASLAVHLSTVIVLSLKGTKIFTKPPQKIQVTYQNVKTVQMKKEEKRPDPMKVAKRESPELSKRIDILSKDTKADVLMGQEIKDVSKLPEKLYLSRKEVPVMKTMETSNKVTVPLVKSDKITNPKYLSYSQAITRRIEQRAHLYVNHPKFEAGKVYLTFVLKNDGSLAALKIHEDKTSANEYVRKVAQRSVEESSPFGAFPRDLMNYPEMSFNVEISFQVGNP